MLRKIEPRDDGRPNYQTDAPKADWDNFLDSLSDIGQAKRNDVEAAVGAKVAERQAKLAGKREAKRPKGESRP